MYLHVVVESCGGGGVYRGGGWEVVSVGVGGGRGTEQSRRGAESSGRSPGYEGRVVRTECEGRFR